MAPLSFRRAFLGVLALAAGLVALAPVAPASALTPPPQGWGAAYEGAAIAYWGEEATRCTTTSVTFDSSLPERHRLAQIDGRVLGRATVTSTPGTDCHMWLAPLGNHGVYFRCVLFAHEYGHWIGLPDNPNDPWRSVSAELLGNYTRDLPCRELVAATR